ncbi:MAG: hypothetical protein AB7Q23_07700 [Hyphomonadaceae bacterium]
MPRLVFTALVTLAACATALPQVVERPGDTFDVRFDAAVQTLEQVNALANAHCPGGAAEFVAQETRFDGFAYRTYRCVSR